MTPPTALKRFTDHGIEEFRRYLDRLRQADAAPAPVHLLNDPAASRPIDAEVHIEKRRFDTRMQLARYFDDVLSPLEDEGIETDVHLWSWLSLFYFDQVCPADENGKRRPGRNYRHILEPGYPNGHRHLLCGPYLVYSVYGLGEDLARLLLCTPVPIENKFHHELASRQGLITNRGILEAVHRLYYQPAADKPRRGAQIKKNSPGGFYRFISIIQQLDLNYDLYSMSGDEIIALLPPEFDQWKTQTGSKLEL